MNIIELAEKKDKVLAAWAGKPRPCPDCNETYFSPFDKLYIEAYTCCYLCDKVDSEEVERRSKNIFEIL